MKEITLAILIDAGRNDYVKHMPFVKSLIKKGVYAKKMYNPGGYCERSCFMTGALPEVTGNLFAMSLMPIGYKRASYEPTFNIPSGLRDRLCMTEDVTPDTDEGSFGIESIWDVMRKNGKTWAFEACLALGIKQHNGRTTHGSRPVQLIEKIKQNNPDFAYWQISETDQYEHVLGSDIEKIQHILNWADGEISWVVGELEKHYDKVNLLVFGDHGQTPVTHHIDLPLEYPGYRLGWDYLYLKSSAAIQFWIFNDKVKKEILNDPLLKNNGRFLMKSPSKRQGDLIWAAKPGYLITPCHFHTKETAPVSMHGYQLHTPSIDTEKGFAILVDGEHKGTLEQIQLNDLAETITTLLNLDTPKESSGVSMQRRIKNAI